MWRTYTLIAIHSPSVMLSKNTRYLKRKPEVALWSILVNHTDEIAALFTPCKWLNGAVNRWRSQNCSANVFHHHKSWVLKSRTRNNLVPWGFKPPQHNSGTGLEISSQRSPRAIIRMIHTIYVLYMTLKINYGICVMANWVSEALSILYGHILRYLQSSMTLSLVLIKSLTILQSYKFNCYVRS